MLYTFLVQTLVQYCLLRERNVVTVHKRITRQVYYLEAVCAVSAATYERRREDVIKLSGSGLCCYLWMKEFSRVYCLQAVCAALYEKWWKLRVMDCFAVQSGVCYWLLLYYEPGFLISSPIHQSSVSNKIFIYDIFPSPYLFSFFLLQRLQCMKY